ncbi:MAG: alanine dehydrogenase [Chromatiales bacterium]|nr:MAG: alanine dehydrogenase [Chromatiales bacterium]
MLIGVPKEIKTDEYRVGLTPSSVRELVAHGCQVVVQTGAGAGIGMGDDAYRDAGANIAADAAAVFADAQLIVKVKEPQPPECAMLSEGQVLFTYLHLAPDPDQAKALLDSGCIAIAYETVTDEHGGLPLLAPMSEVAGRMAMQAGAHCLEREAGGAGILLGGVAGVPPAHVLVIGGGTVGTNALRVALGMEAQVTVIDKSLFRLKELDLVFGGGLNTIFGTAEAVEHYVADADVVVGAVLVPGAEAPKLVSRAQVARMRPGSVLVDVAIDQGGCFETSRPTTHSDPTYVEEGVVHYCVANMPGAVPRTSAYALNNATLPYVLALAQRGYPGALLENRGLRDGLNVHCGQITHPAVADALGYRYVPPVDAMRV